MSVLINLLVVSFHKYAKQAMKRRAVTCLESHGDLMAIPGLEASSHSQSRALFP